MTLPKAWLSWSTGKDSAWALHTVRKRHEVEIVALLTTINAPAVRVAMHAVRQSLLDIGVHEGPADLLEPRGVVAVDHVDPSRPVVTEQGTPLVGALSL